MSFNLARILILAVLTLGGEANFFFFSKSYCLSKQFELLQTSSLAPLRCPIQFFKRNAEPLARMICSPDLPPLHPGLQASLKSLEAPHSCWLIPHIRGEDWRAPQRGVMEPRAHTGWSGSGLPAGMALPPWPSQPPEEDSDHFEEGAAPQPKGKEEGGAEFLPLGQDPKLFTQYNDSTHSPSHLFFQKHLF